MTWKVIDRYFRLDRIYYPLIFILENKNQRKIFYSSMVCIIIGDKVRISKNNKGEYLERVKWIKK